VRWRRLSILALLGAALLLTGCAGRAADFKSADKNQGKQLFVKSCGGCHTLGDAAVAGTTGPNLDDAFLAARSKAGGGFEDSTFFQITLDQMRLAAPPMPHFDKPPYNFTEEQLVDVAAYVASVAGKPVQRQGQASGGATGTATSP
jgi:mono/diheme cytochrome c family protein